MVAQHMKKFTPQRRTRREGGFTLMEMLIVATLLSVLAVAVTAVILNLSKTTNTMTTAQTTQDSLNNAVAVSTREISALQSVRVAEKEHLELVNQHGDSITYLYVNPDTAAAQLGGEFGGKTIADIPDITTRSFVEVRSLASETHAYATVLVTDVPVTQEETGLPLFTYYTKGGIYTADLLPTEINRIALRITANSTDRDRPIEITTSVSLYQTVAAMTGNIETLNRPAAPILYGRLPRPQRNATLWWDHVAGATSYTLYRDNSAIATFSSADELEYVDSNRAWGSTQEYYVVAAGPGGVSPTSNLVRLTVVPEKPAFRNINSTGAVCTDYTVARNLTNCTMWTSRDGATGYRLVATSEGNATIYNGANLKATHNRTYGDVTTYVVVAYNVGENGSGGDSINSDPVTLISPPTTPTLNGTHSNGDRRLGWTRPDTALGYRIDRATSNPTNAWAGVNTITNGDTVAWNDTSALVAVDFHYRITAYNNAGSSPVSPQVNLKPNPGAISSFTVTSSNGDRVIARGNASNATAYYLERTTPSATDLTSNMGSSYTDTARIVSSNFGYSARAWNKTGFGPARGSSVDPRPGVPTVTVRDYTDGYDGRNVVQWSAPANATEYKYDGRHFASVTGVTSRTYTDTSPGWDSSRGYRAAACNYTGCSEWSGYVEGRQPPGRFNVVSMEWKQSGQTTYPDTGIYSQTRIRFLDSQSRWTWTASANSDRVRVYRGSMSTIRETHPGGSSGSYTWDNTPGAPVTFRAVAEGDTSGVDRAVTSKVVASPSQMRDVYVRGMARSAGSTDSNTRWWSNTFNTVAGNDGTVYSVEVTAATNGFGKDPDGKKGRWSEWNYGTSKTSGSYSVTGASSSNWKGGLQGVRVASIPQSGYGTYDRVISREGESGEENPLSSDYAINDSGWSWVTFSAMRKYAPTTWNIGCGRNDNVYEGYRDADCNNNYTYSPGYGHEAVFGSSGAVTTPSKSHYPLD